jgi:hypothetical protein
MDYILYMLVGLKARAQHVHIVRAFYGTMSTEQGFSGKSQKV